MDAKSRANPKRERKGVVRGMMTAEEIQMPFALPPTENRMEVARGIYVEEAEDTVSVFIGPAKFQEYKKKDKYHERLVIVCLAQLGCKTAGLSRVFRHHRNTVNTYVENAESLGLAGLLDGREGPYEASKLTPKMIKRISKLADDGLKEPEIRKKLQARGFQISKSSIYRALEKIEARKVAQDVSEHPADAEQTEIPFFLDTETSGNIAQESPERQEISEASAELSKEEDLRRCDSPEHRESESAQIAQEVCAALDGEGASGAVVEVFLTEGEPIESKDSSGFAESHSTPFSAQPGAGVSYAGAWLAWPYLSALGILRVACDIYGEFASVVCGRIYGLAQSILSLFFMSLLGFPTLESFKLVDTEGFRRLIGALRCPTVKTLREKLDALSLFGKGLEFLLGLARRYIVMGMVDIGALYIDGHFKPYFGKRLMGKGYYTIRRLAHPGANQYFVNDRAGRPLFFLLREGNQGMVKVFPDLLEQTRSLVGEKQVTYIFDRGGSCAKVLKMIRENDDIFITYKKGKFPRFPGGAFRPHKVISNRWGRRIEKVYDLVDTKFTVNGYGEARLIVVKKKDKQTPIITNDRERSAGEVVGLMFNRWGQENFFKYMISQYSLDELGAYEIKKGEALMVANPEWVELNQKIRSLRERIGKEERSLGKMVSRGEQAEYSGDGRKDPFVIKVATLKRMKTMLVKLREKKKATAERVPLSHVQLEPNEVISLEQKVILDAAKLASYNAEEWLLDLLQPHYRNWRDPRPVLNMILAQKGDILARGDLVTVRLDKFSKPVYQRAAIGLCRSLNELEPRSWDGKWRIKYEVKG